jgi:hypothetical protein
MKTNYIFVVLMLLAILSMVLGFIFREGYSIVFGAVSFVLLFIYDLNKAYNESIKRNDNYYYGERYKY